MEPAGRVQNTASGWESPAGGPTLSTPMGQNSVLYCLKVAFSSCRRIPKVIDRPITGVGGPTRVRDDLVSERSKAQVGRSPRPVSCTSVGTSKELGRGLFSTPRLDEPVERLTLHQ